MTCKDCIHYYACSAGGGLYNEKNESKEMRCNNFQDKSLYIKLPCKLGDTVYVLMEKAMPDYEYKNGVNEITVRHIRIRSDGIIVSDFWGFIDFIFGKRAFLTREEAEKAFAERGKNDERK